MKRTSVLRRQVTYVLGLFAFASGLVASAALADGLPPALGASVALPTVSVSTPVATATVAPPTVTAPVPTTVALPAVTASTPTPVATVTTPAVPAVPAKTVSVAVPAVPAKTVSVAVPAVPAKTVSVAVPAVPAKTVSVAVTAKPVSVTVAAKAAPAPVVHASVTAAAPSAPLPTAHAATGPPLGAATPTTAAQAVTSVLVPLVQQAQTLASPLAPLPPVPARPLRGPFTFVGPSRDAGRRVPDAARASVLVSPLASRVGTGPLPVAQSASEIRPVSSPATSTWSGLGAHRTAVTGGLLALTALAALGLAGAARSPTTVAACAELVRFPFPRFRVVPCPGSGTTADVVGASHSALGSTGVTEAAPAPGATVRSQPTSGGGPTPGRQVVPRLGGVLGAGISTSHPWEVVKTVVLAMLAAANAVLLAVRWRLRRLQGR